MKETPMARPGTLARRIAGLACALTLASVSLQAQDVTGYLTAGRRIADPDVPLAPWSPLADAQQAVDTSRFTWAVSGAQDNLDRQGSRLALGTRTRRLHLGVAFESATLKNVQEVNDFTATGNTIPVRDSRVTASASSTIGQHVWAGLTARYTQTLLADLNRSGEEVLLSGGWRYSARPQSLLVAMETNVLRASDTTDDRPQKYASVAAQVPLGRLPVAIVAATTWLASGPYGPSRSAYSLGADARIARVLSVRGGISEGPRNARDMALDVTLHLGIFRIMARATTGRPDVTARGVAIASDR